MIKRLLSVLGYLFVLGVFCIWVNNATTANTNAMPTPAPTPLVYVVPAAHMQYAVHQFNAQNPNGLIVLGARVDPHNAQQVVVYVSHQEWQSMEPNLRLLWANKIDDDWNNACVDAHITDCKSHLSGIAFTDIFDSK